MITLKINQMTERARELSGRDRLFTTYAAAIEAREILLALADEVDRLHLREHIAASKDTKCISCEDYWRSAVHWKEESTRLTAEVDRLRLRAACVAVLIPTPTDEEKDDEDL